MIRLLSYPGCNKSGYEIREAALYLFYDSLHKLGSGLSREMIHSMNYSEKELKAVEKELSE